MLTPLAGAQTPSPTEVQALKDQIAEQQKMLKALQDALAEQQKRLDAMTAVPAPAPAKAAVVAAAPAAPAAAPPKAAPSPVVAAAKPAPVPAAPRWFEKYNFRGYAQLRDNRLVATNEDLQCEQCDRTIGRNNNLTFRRARFIFSGDINDRIFLYFQPDFATTNGNLNFGQIRDLYFDVAMDKKKEYRVRLGISKVPYGFENMQSSSNRLALDRDDSINSALVNERDFGAFFYYAPAKIRTRLATLSSTGTSGLKGSGDYGVLAFGVFNGQTNNRPEANNNLHMVARAAYPWQLKNGQYIEAGIQAYSGRYTVTSDQRTVSTRGPSDFTFVDRRAAASFILYPQPWGVQAEYNLGKGPQFNPATRTIIEKALRGGYTQVSYMKRTHGQVLTPFVKYQYYSGGKKHELDARKYLVRDYIAGVEWQQSNFFEITGQYSYSDRTYEDAVRPNNRQKGSLFRLQVQVNY